MRRLTLAVVGLLWGLPTIAFAADAEWHSKCPLSPTTGAPTMTGSEDSNHTITARGQVGCWIFNTDQTDESPAITIGTETGLIWFDPNTLSAGTSGASVKIHWCVGNFKPAHASHPEYVCADTGGVASGETALTGTEGSASVQNAGNRFGPGVFYVEVVDNTGCGAALAGQCVVYVRGEGVNP